MKLNDWIKREKLTSAAFGALAGIGGKQLVHRYRHGLRFPSPENLQRIREATQGEVTSEDFITEALERRRVTRESVAA